MVQKRTLKFNSNLLIPLPQNTFLLPIPQTLQNDFNMADSQKFNMHDHNY